MTRIVNFRDTGLVCPFFDDSSHTVRGEPSGRDECVDFIFCRLVDDLDLTRFDVHVSDDILVGRYPALMFDDGDATVAVSVSPSLPRYDT